MVKEKSYFGGKSIYAVVITLTLGLLIGCASSGGKTAGQASMAATDVQPMVIPSGVTCGKCGMYPANYPRWQSEIIFTDGSMTPFDGCKCLFNFMFSMEQYDKSHSAKDVSAVFVKDFNTGEWLNAPDAHFVVGSDMMGPMGKELIPFADQAAAMKFHKEHGGSMMTYAEITPEVMKSPMGGMKGQMQHMKM